MATNHLWPSTCTDTQLSILAESAAGDRHLPLRPCGNGTSLPGLGLLVREVGGGVAVRLDLFVGVRYLFVEVQDLLTGSCDDVGAGLPAQWRLLPLGDGDRGCRNFRRILALPAVHRLTRRVRLGGALGVVLNEEFRLGRGSGPPAMGHYDPRRERWGPLHLAQPGPNRHSPVNHRAASGRVVDSGNGCS